MKYINIRLKVNQLYETFSVSLLRSLVMKVISVGSLTLSLSLLVGLTLISCGQNNNSESTATNKNNDPVEQLKGVIEQMKPQDEGIFDPGDDVGKRIITNVKVVDTTYDVQKTDSLVTPYLGVVNYTINYNVEIPSDNSLAQDQAQCKTTYTYQDGQWGVEKQEYYLEGFDLIGWSSFDGKQKSVPTIACGFIQ